jgi:hypothetical protein
MGGMGVGGGCERKMPKARQILFLNHNLLPIHFVYICFELFRIFVNKMASKQSDSFSSYIKGPFKLVNLGQKQKYE